VTRFFREFDLKLFLQWKEEQIIHLGTPGPTLSFQEIMEKVQRNEMPEIESIPNKTHENASESDLLPIKKPWEQ
jgi:hypothetical protein